MYLLIFILFLFISLEEHRHGQYPTLQMFLPRNLRKRPKKQYKNTTKPKKALEE